MISIASFPFSNHAAEELYVQSLRKVGKATLSPEPENHSYFGSKESTFQQAVSEYEASVEKTVVVRSEVIQTMRTQIDLLIKLRDSHEQRRKKVKTVLSQKNMDYITFRTRDIVKCPNALIVQVKRQRTYITKCHELAYAQQHQYEGDTIRRVSSEEARPRASADSGRETDGSSTSSIQDPRRSMVGFMAQMRTQLANATITDPSRQTARFVKLKKEITEADDDYRKGILTLEVLRKCQIDTAKHAIRHVEATFLNKTDTTKAVLSTILAAEQAALLEESEMMKNVINLTADMDGSADVEVFKKEYKNTNFLSPSQIYYENIPNDILFGISLDEYAEEHGRTVPLLVTKCVEAVERMGLQKEGIYRISGRQSNVDILKGEFEKNEEAMELDTTKYDVFTIASVLKVFLRELKKPLIGLTMQERMDYTMKEEKERLKYLKAKLASLGKPNRDTLQVVISNLAKVNAKAEVNKMNIQNLSVIFTPAIFHDHNKADNAGEWYSDKVLEDLILHHKELFANIPDMVHNSDTDMADPLSLSETHPFNHDKPETELHDTRFSRVTEEPREMSPRRRSDSSLESKPEIVKPAGTKSHGLLRRATMKARAVMPQRQELAQVISDGTSIRRSNSVRTSPSNV
ncbi:hypothetical protein EC973_002967 [Apophysomyces ossiformis]|uniref:Rho-GAP domain-containing protein n=1 Tax=Apophysomyces ossiformis TaxID=679940 RepID=A0A8H7BJX0_9FUNG|nr:hypothetical protein EC973_002967 [Apophysomyces ossiformis]